MLDLSYSEFKKIFSNYGNFIQNIETEEDAKIQLVQRMLVEVLGWRIQDLRCERQHESGFSDYIVSDVDSPKFVVEAKRIGVLNVATAEREKYKPFKISGPALKACLDPITQARQYASDEGLSFYVVTDGTCWIVGKTNVEGKRWKDTEALVFPSLEAISAGFSTFYDALHVEQVRKRIYARIFDHIHENRPEYDRSLFAAFEKSEISLERKSALAFDLDVVFDVYFGKMKGDDDPDLLVNCFVESRESRIADFSLEKLTARILGNISPDYHNLDSNLSDLISSAIEVDDGQTVFIIGPTGAGKTTFLDRFFRKTLPNAVRDQCVVAAINMRDSLGNEQNAVSWLVEELISEFESKMFPSGFPGWDELLGLYFGEYKRRAEGEFKELYERDQSEFKIQFGRYMEERVRVDREGYLKRLLRDLVANRKKLPVFVVDNIDELSFELQKKVFQACQALRRDAQHLLLMFPITDRSAWAFSKSDIFGIYSSKSFFLPTPSPKEVFRKRVEYLRSKSSPEADGELSKSYFLSKGIRVSIGDLQAFTKVLEDVFVANDYASKTIGELSNYNIRRMLLLSRRVITSSIFSVDQLIRNVMSGGSLAPSANNMMNALLKGDYSLYRAGDNSEIYPIFKLDNKIPHSPLLAVRILSLLNSASLSGKDIDDQHLSHDSIVSFFDALGASEASINSLLSELLIARLIEAFDSSAVTGELGRVYSITYSGSCHLRLATENWVYFEQMALTTPLESKDMALEIRSQLHAAVSQEDRNRNIRSLFASYLLSQDSSYLGEAVVGRTHGSQDSVLEKIERMAGPEANSNASGQTDVELTGAVDWYSSDKGYGFIKLPNMVEGVYVNEKTLKGAEITSIVEGDTLKFLARRGEKGMFVASIISVNEGLDVLRGQKIHIVRIFWDRGYGFARIEGLAEDLFFHFSALSDGLVHSIDTNDELHADIVHDVANAEYRIRSIFVE